MKIITKNLINFAIATLVLTLLFRYGLSQSIDHKSNLAITLCAILYTVSMYISGWNFGRKDYDELPIHDVGFRFHLTSYIVHNLVSKMWFAYHLNSRYENVAVIHYTALIWGICLFMHFIWFKRTRKNTLYNLDKEDLFE